MTSRSILLYLALMAFNQAQCEVLSLSSDIVSWTLENENGSISIPGSVPGGVYSDLQTAGVIGDILEGFNDVNTRWVAYDSWTYTAKFDVSPNELTYNVAHLVLEGVDTISYIDLNDSPVGTTNNMFVRYVFDVRKYLKTGTNELRVRFASPVESAKRRSQKHFTAPECVPDEYHGECHANQLRKMQASFSWDWGPAFPSVGLCFLEIYNERVHDLLAEATPACQSLPRRRGNSKKDLRVREHPTRGPYVQNLRRVSVNNASDLLSLVCEGGRRRRSAPTKRNSASSRSHALLALATRSATLHLADLAGSEKASWEGCGGRLKEGANINKSLVALSNVISALVHSGGTRGRFVPYRDSALTWLLKDCFTGGARTYIIATVSPSVSCYGESASTLRWAERARQLPPTKTLPLTVTKAALQAQYNTLLTELARHFILYTPETGKISYDEHHWDLQAKPNEVVEKANIGNIMNAAHPKLDANSETSSVASGSSDVINTMDKNIKIVDEINKEVDKLFVPALERTSSSTDLKIVAPLRHKRRQYRSQEVLQLDDVSQLQSINPKAVNTQRNQSKVPPVTILHDNQRAEIIASVTERLYTKLKKKEEAAASKVESVVEKKIVEPLSELRICTNARQRLIELSQKALRNKRRIGIPAFTQTRRSVIRVKDQSVDVQTDLESYIVRNPHPSYAFHRDVGTETTPMTPRCKEVATGSTYGTLSLSDRSTTTEVMKYKNMCIMTDDLIKSEIYTQTAVVPPPRRKRRALNVNRNIRNQDPINSEEEPSLAPVISINISQTYPTDTESQTSDDSLEFSNAVIKQKAAGLTTPDLLTNHCDVNPTDNKINGKDVCIEINSSRNNDVLQNSTDSIESFKQSEDFPDTDDYSLPRVSVESIPTSQLEMKNMILGRNKNIYPYNIVLSPPKERDTKRIVTFKDIDVDQAINVASQTDWEIDREHNSLNTNICLTADNDSSTDTTDSSKLETASFIWSKGNGASKTLGCLKRTNYVPVYKTNPRQKMKNQFYRELLGLDAGENKNESLPGYFANYTSSDTEQYPHINHLPRGEYLQRREEKRRDLLEDFEKQIAQSCNELERSANSYERYLANNGLNKREFRENTNIRTPSAHLQHLVNLRREVVRAEGDTTE